MTLWAVFFAVASASPCATDADGCMDGIVERIVEGIRGGDAQAARHHVSPLMRLCDDGVEMACLLRHQQASMGGPLTWTNGPCARPSACPQAQGVLVPEKTALPPPPGSFSRQEKRYASDGSPQVAYINDTGEVVLVVPAPTTDEWGTLPGPRGQLASCLDSRTIAIRVHDEWQDTGSLCGMARWDAAGERLWIQAGGGLAEVSPEEGIVRTWWLPCLLPGGCRITGAADQRVWFTSGTSASLRTPTPLVPAQSADELAGLWRSGSLWLYVTEEVASSAAQHGALVVANGEHMVLDGGSLFWKGGKWRRSRRCASLDHPCDEPGEVLSMLPTRRRHRLTHWSAHGSDSFIWSAATREWEGQR